MGKHHPRHPMVHLEHFTVFCTPAIVGAAVGSQAQIRGNPLSKFKQTAKRFYLSSLMCNQSSSLLKNGVKILELKHTVA